MGFDSFNRSEKEPTNKRISRIHDDCEESCNNKNVHQGVQVPQQPVGTGLPGFAYFYDTTAQVVPSNGQVTFNTNGNITPAGFVTHVPGTAPITIKQTGIYLIIYEVTVLAGPYAFALFNGDNQIAGSNYGGIPNTATQNGQVITPLNASDVLTLRNIDDSPKPLFNGNVGIPAVISASMVILRLV